jgi:CO dehydrogenase/acetyl-CoA synthase beta subunit
MAKLKLGEKRVQLSFQRPDDLKLFEFMTREAYRCRWDLQTFVLASLQEAFKDRIDAEEEKEVSAIAEEAARKVRERSVTPAVVEVPAMPTPTTKPIPVSMEIAMSQAEAQIASLNPPGMKLKRGKIPAPPSN